MYGHKSTIFSWDFLKDAHDIVLALPAHAQAATANIVDGGPYGFEPGDQV